MARTTLAARMAKRISGIGTIALALSLTAGVALAETLTIGVTPGSLADSIEVAATEARSQGLDVKVIEFTDWTTPNVALNAGDLDVNYFQHQAFLDNAVAETGYKLKSVAVGLLPNLGLYSSKFKSFGDLPQGGRVGVASDPVNQGRGLLLLERAGLIKLRDGVGSQGTLDDIAENQRELQFVEIEGPQLVRALDDVDLAQGYPAHYVNAGKPDVAGQALLYSGIDDLKFAIRFVTREDNADDPLVRRFVEIYQGSDAVKAQIHKSFADDNKLYSLPWTEGASVN
ncbi:D-methionine transport system substrate-binding protein [Rhizobium azooxidifex]|uniref:D-methionine transport system substrate-binding protein n=1 Tax=Mycoplana azooxidifex TaxID=1636188 RepID=A0A7W6GJH4_9HYPH|nr:MetQ/NlpA family ABC transporter substrate-binding protein [Mycoplana azooxidifex]MBB3977585.1 D-methionine transport system substrate-binding protein [Mycoplana azooxidifex]